MSHRHVRILLDAPADLPVSFSDLVFAREAGFEGRLLSVTASFAQ